MIQIVRGCSSMVEHQPSKLDTWVRFPSPALLSGNSWLEFPDFFILTLKVVLYDLPFR
jgi:hypothetical protein